MRKVLISMALFCGFILNLPAYSKSYPLRQQVAMSDVTIDFLFKDEYSYHKKKEIAEIIEQGFTIYTSIFGGLPRDLKDKQYSKIRLEVKEGTFLGGEADPGIIILSLSDSDLFGFANWKTILLHELFHLWNAESFRYNSGYEHWFNEGVSEFYTYQTAAKMKLLQPKEALSIAKNPIGYYTSAKGLGQVSMREAGKDNKSKFDHYFLVYHGGWVAAMVLDYQIRVDTNNEKSLDSLMAWLYVNFVRSKKLYSVEDIITGLKKTTGRDYEAFFRKYIIGKETIPVANYFHIGKALWNETFEQGRPPSNRILFQTLGIASDEFFYQ